MKVKDLKEILAKVDDETIIIFNVESELTKVFIDIEEAETGCSIESNDFDTMHEGYDETYQLKPDEKIITISFGNNLFISENQRWLP